MPTLMIYIPESDYRDFVMLSDEQRKAVRKEAAMVIKKRIAAQAKR